MVNVSNFQYFKVITKEPYQSSLSFSLFPVVVFKVKLTGNVSKAYELESFVSFLNDSVDSFWKQAKSYSKLRKPLYLLDGISFSSSQLGLQLEFQLYKFYNEYKTPASLVNVYGDVSKADVWTYVENFKDIPEQVDGRQIDQTGIQVYSNGQVKQVKLVKSPVYLGGQLFVENSMNGMNFQPITLIVSKRYVNDKDSSASVYSISILKDTFERLI